MEETHPFNTIELKTNDVHLEVNTLSQPHIWLVGLVSELKFKVASGFFKVRHYFKIDHINFQ